MISPSNPSLYNLGSYVEDKAKILSELKGKDDNKEIKYTTELTQMNSQRFLQRA